MLIYLLFYIQYSVFLKSEAFPEFSAIFYHFCVGEPHMKASDLARWVNTTLELVEEDGYGTRTMVTWLHRCGFKVNFWTASGHFRAE